jgi:RNA 3'-phosphate cyclase
MDRRATFVDIDGAHGEGGGQLVRTAVALAAVRGVPIRIRNVRARRRKPGLAAQHAAAVRAVAQLCDARCEGAEVGSTDLTFVPRRLRGGSFEVDVGTAGSIPLVLQAMLPAALATGERVAVSLRGGTDVRAAPPIDYLRLVLLPLLATMGVRAELEVVRRGYYPRGGGTVRLALEPTARLRPFVREQVDTIEHFEIHTHVARLPDHVALRLEAAARAWLPPQARVETFHERCPDEQAASPGGAIVLRAVGAHVVLGAGEVAQRGVSAEQLGHAAGQSLRSDLDAGATLDVHAADQMLAYQALADGPSVFRAARVSSHAATAMWLLEQLGAASFEVTPADPGVHVNVRPTRA